jgi:hypothetical protein
MGKEDGESAGGDLPPADDIEAQKAARRAEAVRKAEAREARLRAQLRANLQRRKLQSRARREGEADDRPGDLDPTSPRR